MIEHALAYARAGFYVFPLAPRSKEPLAGTRGVLDATTDPETIRQRFSAIPDANVGLALWPSGLVAIDVDEYKGDGDRLRALEERLGELPATLVQRSGSGQGLHLIYRAPGFPVRGILDGITLRGRNYLAVAPSVHPSGGAYEWLTDVPPAELPPAWREAFRRPDPLPAVDPSTMAGELAERVAAGREILAEWCARAETEMSARVREVLAGRGGEGCDTGNVRVGRVGYTIGLVAPEIGADAALEIMRGMIRQIGRGGLEDRACDSYLAGAGETAAERAAAEATRDFFFGPGGLLRPRPFAETVRSPAPPEPVTATALVSALRAAGANLARRKDPDDALDGDLLGRAARFEPIAVSLGDDPELLAARTIAAAARAAPPGTSADVLLATLEPSLRVSGVGGGDLTPAVARALADAAAERAEAEERKAARAAARKKTDDPENDEDLRGRLTPGKDGEGVRPSGKNIERILRWSQELRGRLQWDALTKAITVTSGQFADVPPSDLPVALKNWLESEWFLEAKTAAVGEQMLLVARRWGSVDPLATYLRGLRWDGVPRCEEWLLHYCGAEDTQYNRMVGAMWLVSAVARGLEPGTKVDTVLVLEGAQGTKKSTALKVLGGGWFSDTPLVLGDKDSRMVAGMRWIVELAELASLRGRENEALKAFLSSSEDNFRPPYGRVVETFARRCVFAGTTNEAEYLHDPTGARRFWCVKIARCDADALARDRDQLWAEAVHLHATGTRWWFEEIEQRDLADMVTEERRAEDAWASKVLSWWNALTRERRGGPFTLADVAESALAIRAADLQRYAHAVARTLREIGWTCKRTRHANAWSPG